MLKNLPANVRDAGLITALERSLGDMATYCSILAWEITWTEEPGRLQSTGSQRVGHDGATKHFHFHDECVA